MKSIIMTLIGVVLGATLVHACLYEAPVKEAVKEEPVILGHRIGPNGSEMLVYSK